MFHSHRLILSFTLLLTSGVSARCHASDSARLVTLGGTITEIVFALGAGNTVVGVDSSSVHPAAVERFPIVGYQRRLSAEGILSLMPTRVLATADAGPPAAITQLRDAGVAVDVFPSAMGPAKAIELVEAIAAALGRQNEGAKLAARMVREIDAATRTVADLDDHPRVLFVYARGPGAVLVGGSDTEADAMIRLAGAVNAGAAFAGFKPLSAEGVIASAPDVVLVTSRGAASLGGTAAALDLPGLWQTPAGAARRVVAMDDLLLLGFGPRLGTAIAELAVALRAAPPE